MILFRVPCNRLSVSRIAHQLKSLKTWQCQTNARWASIRVTSLGLGVCSGLCGYHVVVKSLVSASHVATCKSPPLLVRTSYRSHDEEIQFDWSMLWKYMSPDLLLLSVAIVSAMLCALLNIAIPMELGRLVNVISGMRGGRELKVYLRELLPSGLTLALLYATQGVLTSVYIGVLSVIGERLACRLRTSLLDSLLRQDITFFDVHKTGELVSRLSADVQDLKSSFKLIISQGLRGTTQLIGCVASLLYISPQMTVLVGVALPLLVTMGTAIGSVLRRLSRRAQENVAKATGVADEALSNVRTVRAFAMEPSEIRLYSKQLSEAKRDNEYLGLGIAIFQGLSNFAINGMVLAVVSNGGVLLAMNQISPGQLMSFLVSTQTIQKSLGSLSVLFSQVVRGMSAGSRVFQYMNRLPVVNLTGGLTLPQSEIKGCVSLERVTFAYKSRPNQTVLDDLSLTLSPGSVTALCGLSGAGKSTVASLLERFYEPTQGRICLDGHVLKSLDPSWLRGEIIGYISQEPVLFSGTVAENIRYGDPAACDEQIVAAAKLANAHTFIEEFPKGYSTVVGERGQALSGGQKQRVAIARAVLKNPKILILDEATSALDAHSESLVQEALDRACEGRTVLVIAHRLSTIRNAHQIAVLHNGKLKEVGTHAELMATGKYYRELIRRQTVID